MPGAELKVHLQSSAYASPWGLSSRILRVLWDICWALFCGWTPKPLNRWRLFWLKVFGCKIHGTPFVHQKARILIPWNLILHDRACLGDGANAYTLGVVEIKCRATVAQEVYLCTGSHDFSQPHIPLITAKITVNEDAFIGARAFIMPGVTVGEGTVIGACSLVTHDMPDWKICVGHPCKPIKDRPQCKTQ